MMREGDPVSFRNQAKETGVPVKRPVPAKGLDAQAALVFAVECGFRNIAIGLAVDQIDGLGADPLH